MSTSVNVLTEAFALEQPPRLIDINRDEHFKVVVVVTALVNKK